MMKWVTPSLAVCGEDERPERFTASEVLLAVDWILQGNTAFVVDDNTARQVLMRLGLTPTEADDRLHFANTGTVL